MSDRCPAVSGVHGTQIDFSDASGNPGDMLAITVSTTITGWAGILIKVYYGGVFDFVERVPGSPDQNFVYAGGLFSPDGPLTSAADQSVFGPYAAYGLVNPRNSVNAGTIGTLYISIRADAVNPNRVLPLIGVEINDQFTNTVAATIGSPVVTVGDCTGTPAPTGPLEVVAFSNSQKVVAAWFDSAGALRWSRSQDDADHWAIDASEG